MKLVQISDFKLGKLIYGFFLCKEKQLRYTRNGDMYIDIIFSDATGVISGKLWDLVLTCVRGPNYTKIVPGV